MGVTLGRISLFALALVTTAAGPASAQQAPRTLPRSSEPSQIERRLEAPERPPAGAVEVTRPEAPPRPTADPAEIRLVLAGVVVAGSTVYPPDAFAPLYQDLLAREVTLAQLSDLAAAITKRYRDDGYVLSYAVIPPQDLDFGLLRIEVVEGFLADVAFTGTIAGDAARLERMRATLTAERPLTLATLERQLLLLADITGLQARASMSRRDDASGAHELTVALEHTVLQGLLYADNRGTRDVGRWLGLGQLTAASLLGAWETTRLRVSTVPDRPRELLFGELTQDWLIGGEGTRLGVSASWSRVEASGPLEAFEVVGRDQRFSLRLTHPVMRQRDASLWLHGEAVWRDSVQDSNLGRLTDDRLRVLRAGALAIASGPWDGTTTLAAEISQGLPILGAAREPSAPSRFDADSEFHKFALILSRQQPLWGPLAVNLTGAGQVASEPLLSPEEFALGGPQFGRAYDVAELTGDDGFGVALELQYALGGLGWESGTAFVFADYGAVLNRGDDGRSVRNQLASAGFGVRGRILDWAFVQGEVAKPLSRDVFLTEDRNWRAFFSFTATF